MTNLKVTHFYLDQFSLAELVNMALGEVLRETSMDTNTLAKRLRWHEVKVAELVRYQSVPEFDGPDIVSVSLAEVQGKSIMRARHAIENKVVRHLVLHFNPENCNRLIARILRVGEWDIRRIRIRAGIAPARVMRAARLEAAERSKASVARQTPTCAPDASVTGLEDGQGASISV